MRSGAWAGAGVALALALVLSACGSSGGGDQAVRPSSVSAPGPSTTGASRSTTTAVARPTTTAPATTSATTSTTAPPTTTTPPATSPTWDQIKGAAIPALCMHGPATLVDGQDRSLGPNDGVFELNRTLQDGGPAMVTGLPSEVGPLTAVVATCNAGGVGWPDLVVLFAPGGRFYAASFLDGPSAGADGLTGAWQPQWDAAGGGGPARDGIRAIQREGDSLAVWMDAELPGDASCCPSGAVKVTVRPANGSFELADIASDVGD